MSLVKALLAVAVSGVVAVSATAQELPAPQQKKTPAVDLTKKFDGKADYQRYSFTSLPESVDASEQSGDVLLAGTEMVDRITGEKAYVSGVVTVLTENVSADDLASEFGLTVERVYSRLNLAMLKAPEGTDMLQLREQLKGVEGVNSIKVEIVENIRKPHVL
jgi:translation elongation factor EF-1beta